MAAMLAKILSVTRESLADLIGSKIKEGPKYLSRYPRMKAEAPRHLRKDIDETLGTSVEVLVA